MKRVKQIALQADEVYKLDWHKDANKIEAELQERRTEDQGWISDYEAEFRDDVEKGETLAALRKETRTHPELEYVRERRKATKKVKPRKKKEEPLPELEESFARRIT